MDALVLIDNSKLHEQASLLSSVEYRFMSENLLERSCAITETPHLQILPSNHFRKGLGISLNDRQILKALVLFLSLAVKGWVMAGGYGSVFTSLWLGCYSEAYLSSVTVGTDPIILPSWHPLRALLVNSTFAVELAVSGCPPGLGIRPTVYVKVWLPSSAWLSPGFTWNFTVFPSGLTVTVDFEGYRKT